MNRSTAALTLALTLASGPLTPARATEPSGDPDADRRAALATVATLLVLTAGATSAVFNGIMLYQGERDTLVWPVMGVSIGALFFGLGVAIAIDQGEPLGPGARAGALTGGVLGGLGIAAWLLPEEVEAVVAPVPLPGGGGLGIGGRF